MITNKKGLTLKDWVVATLMFSAIFSMGIIMIAGFSADSGLANNMTNPTIEGHYNKLDQNLADINQTINAVNQPGGLTLVSGFQAFLGGTVAVFTIILNSMGILPAMFINFASDFGVPSIVATLFFTVVAALVAVIVIFAILNASKGGGRI